MLGLTGAVSALVTAFALLADVTWGVRYGLMSALALLNWFALSKVISGLMTKNTLDAVVGLMIKPLLLVLVLIAGKNGMIEVTSFLVAVNTFFLTLFGYMAWRAFAPSNRLDTAGASTNG